MLKVLVVDDEMPIRQWLEFCIERIPDVELVGAASHGAEGYSMFRKHMPDVVITDIRMPVMDGLEMMRMIRNLKPSVYAIVLTSFEDFEYARQAISLGAAEYILKTEISDGSLRENLKKAAAAIGREQTGEDRTVDDRADRNYLLRSLVQANAPVPCLDSVLDSYGVRLKKGPFYAINVSVESAGEAVHRPKTGFLQNSMKFSVDANNVMIVGNVGAAEGEDELEIRRACREYCGAILKQIPCWIGVSDLRSGREHLSEAMMEAYRRAKRRFYHPQEQIFASGNMWNWRLEDEEKYKILFSKRLIGQELDEAVKIKNQVLDLAAREEPLNVEELKHLFEEFMVSILHMTKEDISRVKEDVRKVREELAECRTMEELRSMVNQFFADRGLEGKDVREYSQAVRRAVDYMEKNYASPIALTDVAAHVGLSSEYLSRLFKEDTGMKFVVYLNNLRLRHALSLLENTSLKVYEVAERVGYSNLSYFSTVFKKNFGQNPFEFKNRVSGHGRQESGADIQGREF